MSRMVRSDSLLSRVITTYLVVVVAVMFTGIGAAVPVSYAEEAAVPLEASADATGTAEPVADDEAPDDTLGDDSGDAGGLADTDDAGVEADSSNPGDEGVSETKDESRVAASSTVTGGGATTSSGQTSGRGVPAVLVPGNPTCGDLSPSEGYTEFKIDKAPTNGVYPVPEGGTVTISNATSTTFDWSATGIIVYKVVAKGGPDANLYDYVPLGGATWDTGLQAPINPNNNQPYGLSHVSFCFKPAPKTVVKTFELTYSGAPADATFFARYWLSGSSNPEPDVALVASAASKYAGSVTLPKGSTITRVDWYATYGGVDILLGSETMSETLNADKTNTFTYSAFIKGMKFHDLDADGVKDPDDPGLEGWRIELYRSGTLYAWTTTDSAGKYAFWNPLPGSYTLAEVLQPGWFQTAAPAGSFTVVNGTKLWNKDFGNALESPELTLEKSATPQTYDAAGDVITYTYTLTNSGNVTLDGPFTVTDDKADTSRTDVAGDPDVLAPGEHATFSATYTIDQADIDAGFVTNIAQGFGFFAGDEVASNEDDETVTALQNPSIEIIKLTNGSDGEGFLVGTPITWSYAVTNTGNVTLTNVIVTDDQIGLIGTIPVLAPGETQTLLAEGVAEEGPYMNVGTVIGTPPTGEDVSDSDESDYFGSSPAISVEKSVDSDLVIEGEEVTYTFVVTNTGNTPLYNVVVEDDHLGMIATIAMLDVGASQTFTRTVAIFEATTNIVVATGSDQWGNQVSDEDEAFVDIDEFLGFGPDLYAKKSADKRTANPGDIITYTVELGNVGGDPAFDYTVVDTFNARYLTVVDAAGGTVAGNRITWTFPGPLAFGETQTIVYKLKVAEDMPDGTTVLDNVVVVSHPEDDNPDNDRSTWSVTVRVSEPFLPFTGGDALSLLVLAAATGALGAALRRRARLVS